MPRTISQIGEFGLIRHLKKSISTSREVIKGIGDDAAVVAVDAKHYSLFTTDMIAEGAHFTRGSAPEQIGHKVLACNISDIAAMGGVPKYGVMSLGLSANLSVDYVQRIYSGMNRLAKKFHVNIVGGDTIKTDKLIINIALLGAVQKKYLVTRCGAKAGDWIFVTGPLGRSLPSGKHLTFTPRIAESQFLVQHYRPNAMIDISDGLAGDLRHILKESRVGAVLYEDRIPLTKGAVVKNALYDGEDFELLFTLPRKTAEKLVRSRNRFHFYHIGEIVKPAEKLTMVDRGRQRQQSLRGKAFTHF